MLTLCAVGSWHGVPCMAETYGQPGNCRNSAPAVSHVAEEGMPESSLGSVSVVQRSAVRAISHQARTSSVNRGYPDGHPQPIARPRYPRSARGRSRRDRCAGASGPMSANWMPSGRASWRGCPGRSTKLSGAETTNARHRSLPSLRGGCIVRQFVRLDMSAGGSQRPSLSCQCSKTR